MHSTSANRAAPWCRLVAIWWGLLGIQAVHGQSPAEPPVPTAPPVPKVYTKNQVFRLPVQLSNEERAQLRELKFYVKPLPGPWTCQETAPPSQTSFVYQATADGEYWFNFTTTDKAGRVAPENLDDEVPGLIVVVDTTPPQVDVYPIAVSGGEVMLQCQVRDVAPDLATLKLEYLSPEKRWIALAPYQPNTPELFRVPDPNILSGKVRATVADRAGNVCSREIDLSLAGVIPPEVARTPASQRARRAIDPGHRVNPAQHRAHHASGGCQPGGVAIAARSSRIGSSANPARARQNLPACGCASQDYAATD
jgi:hypothetical protein